MALSSSTGPLAGPPIPPSVELERGASPTSPLGDGQARFLDRLIDWTTQPLAVVDFQGGLTFVNRAFEDLTGYSSDELRGTPPLRQITPERWHEAEKEAAARLRATGKGVRFEKEYLRKDGRLVPVELVLDYCRDDRGIAQGYYAFVTDISERKRIERALRESEERYRLLYDEAPVGYHEIDPDGILVNINLTECGMLGYLRHEMLGRPVFDFMAEEERAEARRLIDEMIRQVRPLGPVERTYLTKSGRRLIVALENRLSFDERGNVVGLRRTAQDITARKRTEAALVASERNARTLFEGIDDGVFVHDLQGRILDANPAACRRLGYTREELLRLTTSDIDDPEFAAGFEDRLNRQLRQGSLTIEGRHRTKDGRVVPVDINTSTILFEDQRAVLAVMRDITERKALEETRRQFAEAQLRNAREIEAKNQALIQSEFRYRRLTEGSLDAVVVADQQGRITLFNRAAERTFGYSAEEAIGQGLVLLMPESYHEAHRKSMERYIQTGEGRVVGRTIELRGRRKSGEEFPMELSLNAVDVGGEWQFIGSIRDQTERNRMREVLDQSERLATIGRLSAGVAHEINNPLAYIANNLAVLERDLKGVRSLMVAYESARGPLADAAPEALAQIDAISDEFDWPYVRENLGRMLTRTREGVQRVANIVQNLRGMARSGPSAMGEAPLAELVASAVEMVQGQFRRKGIEVQVDVDPVLPKVQCVASQIGQVLLNLLVNAIQAIEEAHPTGGGLIRIAIRRAGEFQAVEVHDNGAGISPESLPRLFDPFFTTKPVGEGTGLGLSISHGIVSGHGGRIEVESQPGRGTCFRVVLPQRTPTAVNDRPGVA